MRHGKVGRYFDTVDGPSRIRESASKKPCLKPACLLVFTGESISFGRVSERWCETDFTHPCHSIFVAQTLLGLPMEDLNLFIGHPREGFWGLKAWLFEGPESIESVWLPCLPIAHGFAFSPEGEKALRSSRSCVGLASRERSQVV